jgi:hypothetical protein
MNSEERTLNGRRNVLLVLSDCDGYLLPDNSLKDQLRLQVVPPPTTAEADAWIQFLDVNSYIAGIRPAIGGPVKWQITLKGKLALVL